MCALVNVNFEVRVVRASQTVVVSGFDACLQRSVDRLISANMLPLVPSGMAPSRQEVELAESSRLLPFLPAVLHPRRSACISPGFPLWLNKDHERFGTSP